MLISAKMQAATKMLRKLIAVLRITDSTKDNFKNTETLKTFFENNKELLEDFDRDATVNQMRVDVNPIINSIIEDNELYCHR